MDKKEKPSKAQDLRSAFRSRVEKAVKDKIEKKQQQYQDSKKEKGKK